MELWVNIAVMMFGVFNIAMSFVMHTENFYSSLLFKIVPFFGGMAILVQAAANAGILNL